MVTYIKSAGTKSSFIKEFFLISSIYRKMSAYVKQQLKQQNIPVNETQLNLLFLMYNNEGMSGDEMLQVGNFALSTLLFNMNNLQNASLIATDKDILNTNLHKQIHISEEGYNLLAKIENIFEVRTTKSNINSDKNFYNDLIHYEQSINEKIVMKK